MKKLSSIQSVDNLSDAASLAMLRRRRAESEALFLSIGEGAVVTDSRGNISRINKVALEVLGCTAKEVIGRWYPDVFIAEDKNGNIIPNMERPIIEVFLTGKPVFRRIKYRLLNGTAITVAVTVSPIVMNNIPIGAIEVFRDITHEVELENAKDEFISIASHELRTPATIVKQYLSMVLGGYAGLLTQEQVAMLTTAFENNERQLTIINDLLRVARAEADTVKIIKKEVDFIVLLKDIISDQKEKFALNDQNITLSIDVRKAMVLADPIHVRMIIENLLSNANKYTPEKGSIFVTLSTTKKTVKVAIKDTGVGISNDDMPKLFQKFSRLNNPLSTIAGGSGLGLYWVKKLTDLHGATIKVTSKPGAGTTFTVKFLK